jgi:hypothetical protein
MHIRTQIREEAGRRLEPVGIWVFDSRVDSLSQRELPGIIVSTPSESREPWLYWGLQHLYSYLTDQLPFPCCVERPDGVASWTFIRYDGGKGVWQDFPVAAVLGRTDIDIIGAGEVPVGDLLDELHSNDSGRVSAR